MIFVKNRKFYFSEEEDEIFAMGGDHNVKTVTVCLPTVDFKDYSFRLDLEKENGDKGIAYLTKHVQKDRILLFWKPQNSQLSPGNLKVQLRAFLADNTEVWHSEQTTFYVGESIGATSAYPSVLPSEFEEIEKRIAAMDERISETVASGEKLYAAGEQLYRDGESLYDKVSGIYSQVVANADWTRSNADLAREYMRSSKEYRDEAEEILKKIGKAEDGISPTIEIIPMENTNAYRMAKKAYHMSTIRWCDEADGDINRTLSFTAKVEYTVPYASHSFYVQVRRRNGGDATLMQLGTDGAGNTLVYCKKEKVCQLTDGWHNYSVSWNQESGMLSVIADGMTVFSGENPDLVLTDAHGIQINAMWHPANAADVIMLDSFALSGDGKERYSDNFNDVEIGTSIPANWYQNDSESTNVREVFLNTDQEVYLSITDKEGIKRTGNINGKDAELRAGSVTREILADGSVGMDQLSTEVRALLEQIKTLVAVEEQSENGEG